MDRVKFTSHAVHRYIERVRPTLDFGRASAELEAILFNGPEIQDGPPKWTKGEEPRDGWLMLGEHVTFPLVAHRSGFFEAITCLTPDRRPRTIERRRNRKRQRKAAANWRRTRGNKGVAP